MVSLSTYSHFADFHVSLDKLSLQRGDRLLIDGLSLSLAPKSLVYITGENGIGKTTLLLALAGLLRAESGKIHYRSGAQDISPLQCTSLMVQPDGASRGLTAKEDLTFFVGLSGSKVNIDGLLEHVGLSGAAKVRIEGLSLGQRKRLSLAKILAADRPLWLLDEPFSALDKQGQEKVSDIIAQHLDRGGLCFIATHHTRTLRGVKAQTVHLTASPIESAA